MTTENVMLPVRVIDTVALHEAAVAAYMCGSTEMESALAFLGTAEEPNLVNCLSEIFSEAISVAGDNSVPLDGLVEFVV